MTDWNPNDPDAVRVHYDLSSWSFDQQGELAAALADAEIPHAWEDDELVVPEEFEPQADEVIGEVEDRLGIQPVAPRALADDEPTTEYDLSEWDADRVRAAGRALTASGIAHRMDGAVLLVATDDEDVVEEILDDVEAGEYADVDAPEGVSADGADRVLTDLFLAAERLRSDPLDADGLDNLQRGTAEADPDAPPFGVTPKLWAQACELAERVVDALVEGDEPDEEAAMEAAAKLHELLRPTV